MIVYMIDRTGRQRIAALVRATMGWRSLSGPGIEATGRVSRATVDRVKRGDERISYTTLRALGDVLGLPRDFLIYVGTGDRRLIEASGAEPDLIRWVLDLFEEDPDAGVSSSARA